MIIFKLASTAAFLRPQADSELTKTSHTQLQKLQLTTASGPLLSTKQQRVSLHLINYRWGWAHIHPLLFNNASSYLCSRVLVHPLLTNRSSPKSSSLLRLSSYKQSFSQRIVGFTPFFDQSSLRTAFYFPFTLRIYLFITKSKDLYIFII